MKDKLFFADLLNYHKFTVLIALLVLLSGCVKSVDPRPIPSGVIPDPSPTPDNLDFRFLEGEPNDEQDHDSRLEWWYHSGHLKTADEREFGFHFVVFKSDDGLSEPKLLAQLAITDVETGKHYETSRAVASLDKLDTPGMSIKIADWDYSVLPVAGGHAFSANGDNFHLTLDLQETTPVMLHNEIGWLPTEIGSTYYYSWPRQVAFGELNLEGETFQVSGLGWFDHQWGDFFVLGKPSGWQWIALHLDDGGSLMVTELRGIDGEIEDIYGTYMSPDGEVKALYRDIDGISFEKTGEWTSPSTSGTYPSGWVLDIKSLDMNLTLDPVADDQEVTAGLPVVSSYWEGKVRVSGNQISRPIEGDGYVELSGFTDPDPIGWLGQ